MLSRYSISAHVVKFVHETRFRLPGLKLQSIAGRDGKHNKCVRRPARSIFRGSLLLICLALVGMGCESKPQNSISAPETATPLPDPNDRIDVNGGAYQSTTRPPVGRAN